MIQLAQRRIVLGVGNQGTKIQQNQFHIKI